MTDPRTSRLSAFRKDLDRLAREAEELAESLGRESRLAREESVGAEILVSRDLVAHLGILWDTAEQLGDLAGRQATVMTRDYVDTVARLLDGTGSGDMTGLLGNHVEQRMRHLAQGFDEGVEILSTQTQRACETVFRLWSPFLSVVRQDWTRQRARTRP